jgi:hypothetical protein
MKSWYEFGYNGFPTGEQRRRFYRQRDDPCDSEEERDYDDETNDRPIFYYPLRESEEGSRSSYGSAFSSSASSHTFCEEEEVCTGTVGGNGSHGIRAATADAPRRLRRRSRRAAQKQTSTRCLLHSTLYEDMPAWYGATAVTLVTVADDSVPTAGMLTIQHGGAPCASPFSISNHVSLWQWTTSSSTRLDTFARDEAAGTLRCVRVRDDASLLSRLRWDRLHPTLRRTHSSAAARPPARIGHCAASLATMDSSLLKFFLTDQRASITDRTNTATLSVDQHSTSSTVDVIPELLVDEDVEVWGSLVLGGATQLLDTTSNHSVSCNRHNGGSSFSLSARDSEEGLCDVAAPVNAPNLDGATVPHSSVLSHPALCVTLLLRKGGPEAVGPALRHHTLFFPLDAAFMSVVAPRTFATLTPWVDPSTEATATRTFAYIGGTENGRDPLAFLELEMFRVHLETWSWSCSPVTTYGAKPTPRFGHSANMVSEDHCLLMFGGLGVGHVYLNDLHVLDVRTRVWREVFLPLGLEVPRRAFHMSAVLTDTAATQTVGRRNPPSASSSLPHLSPCTAQEGTALRPNDDSWCSPGGFDLGREGAPDGDVREKGDISDDVNDEEGDVWSSSVTTAQSRCTIVFLGGENEGGKPVTASWACALRDSRWQRLSFPLRLLPHFFHVARSNAGDGARDAQFTRRQLSRSEFRAAVESLAERTAHSWTAATNSGLSSKSLDDTYVAACHGSLAQLLHCPPSAQGAERLLIVGGSRGPPVGVVTQIETINVSLNNTASLWLLAAQQQGSLSVALQQRVSHLSRFFFHSNGALVRAVDSVLHTGSGDTEKRRRPLSEADARSDRLVSESVLDGQLTEWMRLARKRLRDAE